MTALLALLVFAQSSTVEKDIVYGSAGGKDLKLDAYKPAQPIGKVFIAIHGGGFTGGSKGQNMGELCQYLSSRGFTCFDIDYRLQKDVGGTMQDAMKAATEDAVTCYTWVTKNASKYGGDPAKISIGGSSAGAITSLFAVYGRRISVKCVIDLWGGLYDQENVMRKGDPPLLIVHGKNDKTVPYTRAVALVNRANQVGVKYRLLDNDFGHGMPLKTEFGGQTLLEQIDSFLRENM